MKEKQIEEMAEDIKEILGRHLDKTNLYHWVTQELYNKGYRKQSGVIDEFASRLKERLYTIPTVYNSHFGRMIDDIAKDMKGGEEE